MKATKINLAFMMMLMSSLVFSQTQDCGGSPTLLTVNTTCITQSFGNGQDGTGQTVNASCAGGYGTAYQDVWYTVTGTGNTLTITLSGSNRDGVLAAFTGCGTGELACNTIDAGTTGSISFPTTLGVTYYIQIQRRSGNNSQNMGGDICAVDPLMPPPIDNSNCSIPAPICSGTAITFPTTITGLDAEDDINPGNDYGCLFSSPDPTWYYLEIATAGNLVIDMTGSSDIDYALWGPYPNLATALAACNSYPAPIDCSYSIAAVEQASVTGVVVGDVYVMVVTNYAGVVQNITIDEAGSNTASTNCAILPVGLINFNGEKVGKDNLLFWTTESENQNDYFIVEKSYDGLVWEMLDVIEGAGNSSSELNYSTIDERPKLNGVTYYRLKQFDFNGQFEVFDVIALQRKTDELEMHMYPNPAHEKVTIAVSEEATQVVLTNINGKVVVNKQVTNLSSFDLDLNTFSSGIYFVTVYTSLGSMTEKLIIK